MSTIARRIAATAALLAAPALIALGTAASSQAQASVPNTGTSVNAPVHHDAFPQQANTPQPGTSIHHHHQKG